VPLTERVVENLNRALHGLFEREQRLRLLGEDVLDPYGGAFKVTRGLSDRHPDRVLGTPLSEGALVGVAAGFALCGDPVIVEVMFGDFVTLCFDQLVNFAAKSVSMYGRRVPMPIVVRCPVGGNRGYGPTHSQSPQKHLIGVPDLALYELSPFHDSFAVLGTALDAGTPAVFFEDKVLYTRRMVPAGRSADGATVSMIGSADGWAHVSVGPDRRDCVVVAPGGMAHRVLDAAKTLAEQDGLGVDVLVPARLYPLDLDPVLDLIGRAELVCVAEESTAGGTWGAEVAQSLYRRAWGTLRRPVTLVSSKDSVIPTAPHLEREVLVQAETVVRAVREELGRRDTSPARPSEDRSRPAETSAHAITVPKLNNNDTTYVLVEWLHPDGARVDADTPVVTVETSKAVEDLVTTEAGFLRHAREAGVECQVGDVLGHVLPTPDDRPPTGPADDRTPPSLVEPSRTHTLSATQVGVGAVVSASHREVPTAFTAVRADVDAVLAARRRIEDAGGEAVGLAEFVIQQVAAAHREFPLFFGRLRDERTVELADAPHIGVTVDAGTGLFVPVLRDADRLSLADIADQLMDFRLTAMRRAFRAEDLAGGVITVSLNIEDDVSLVAPIVLWPQVCMLSVAGVRAEPWVAADGSVRTRSVVQLGLAYDHRVINGSDAVRFLRTVAEGLRRADDRN
jgi:pyruvate/2-oxoglutarate/acetoin dehydrogenase E1 component/pyruvate/2-oxoglutarate dehydrogenase complex dihydrolipoamide acyltransferase (E2) component